MKERRQTVTSNFGVSTREGHDATPFYERFQAPVISNDDTIAAPFELTESCICGDARSMTDIPDNSVALVVTSPPYFAGKQYEEELEREGIPSSYLEYLEMLRDVFAECVRTLEPGGRIAVNVANLGRKPYRSLSADVIRILADDLGLLLRGELIWQKAEGASGNCAWGSFRSASNPVLRDVSERVIVASKGRFDRAKTKQQRQKLGLPYESTVSTDDFMSLTLDVWSMPPESAKRVGHPAPFPVELPEQLIRLYTYEGDLVLDPFMGSGSTLVAGTRLQRRVVGYDLDPDYVAMARTRLDAARRAAQESQEAQESESSQRDCDLEGMSATKLARTIIERAGFDVTGENRRVKGSGTTVDIEAVDSLGATWWFLVPGSNTSYRGGLLRSDMVWKTLGRATALKTAGESRLVVLTTALPADSSDALTALRSPGPHVFFDIIDLHDTAAIERLEHYAHATKIDAAQPGFWTTTDLGGMRKARAKKA